MKKWIRIGLPVLILALLVWYKWSSTPRHLTGGGTGKRNQPVAVSFIEVAVRSFNQSIQATGTILAMEQVDLVSETSGRIVEIHFKEGAKVEKGQLLIQLNDTEWRAQLKRAQASLKLKKETERRNRQLLEKGAISQEAYDASVSERDASDADVELIREQIRKAAVHAPFSGVMGLRYVSEGSYVNPSTRIASLHTLDQVKIEFSVPERIASLIKAGSECSFKNQSNDKTYTCKVYAIEPHVDEATRNVTMRAICANHDGALIPGGFVQLDIKPETNDSVLVIPTQSVVPILKGKKVYVVVGDSIVEKKIVTGLRQDAWIEVRDGLAAGDKVVVDGVMYVKQGTKVLAKPEMM